MSASAYPHGSAPPLPQSFGPSLLPPSAQFSALSSGDGICDVSCDLLATPTSTPGDNATPSSISTSSTSSTSANPVSSTFDNTRGDVQDAEPEVDVSQLLPLADAHKFFLLRDQHLLGRMHLNSQGSMHYEGFIPFDVLMLMLCITADKYLPHEPDKVILRRGGVVTKNIFVTDLDWYRIMSTQLSQVKSPSGSGQDVSFLKVRHELAHVRTFSLEPALCGKEELQRDFESFKRQGVFLVGAYYFTVDGVVQYEGFVPLCRLFAVRQWTVNHMRPTTADRQSLRQCGKPTKTGIGCTEEEWQQLGLPSNITPTTYISQLGVTTFNPDPDVVDDDEPTPDDQSALLTYGCTVCGNSQAHLCSGCQQTAYCSDGCKAIAWPAHKQHCLNMAARTMLKQQENRFTSPITSTTSTASTACSSSVLRHDVTSAQVASVPHVESVVMCCHVCHVEGAKRCSRCQEVAYCSVKCQTNDWAQHKTTCHPATIKTWLTTHKRRLDELRQLCIKKLLLPDHVLVLKSNGDIEILLPTFDACIRVVGNPSLTHTYLKKIRARRPGSYGVLVSTPAESSHHGEQSTLTSATSSVQFAEVNLSFAA